MEKQSTRKFLKLFVALVALFLLGSSALLLSSCKEEHTHDWGEGTVSVQPTCTAQGFKTFECSCGAVRTEPIQATGHKWDEGKVTTEPTCQPGVKTYTCQNCGETKTESIAATTGHEWVLNEELTVAPTCAKDGVKFYECANCGTTQEIVDPATGNHEYNYEYIDASCEEWGIVIITCKNCTYYKQETDSSKPPLEHNYIVNTDDPNYVAPTCVSQGYGTFECTRCNDTYAGPIAALTTNGQHQWIVNTDTDDTLPGFVLGVGNNYATVDEAKADGWTTVTAYNCTTAGLIQRVCDRCGYIESKPVAATGHSPVGMTEWLKGAGSSYDNDNYSNTEKINAYLRATSKDNIGGVCHINKDLKDAEGNQIYAFECENANCPCEVVYNAYGQTKNLVPAVSEHTYVNANGTEVAWVAVPGKVADCDTAGKEHRYCVYCGEEVQRDVAALGHTWNTLQLDGRTETLKCDPDELLANTTAGLTALRKALESYYDDLYTADAIYNEVVKNFKSGEQYAYFCYTCGALEKATDHEYVIGTLQDGKYGLNDFVVDEDGNVVVAEGVTVDTMTCRNVYVCKNCLTPEYIGEHGTFTTATCREGSECPICGKPGAGQLQHQYVNMGAILNEDTTNGGHADSAYVDDYTYNGKPLTYGQLRAAYEKVVANEAWITPVAATCSSAGTDVYVCFTCLLDAANGVEFDWTKGTLAETDLKEGEVPAPAYEYSAYTVATSDGHDWVAVYYKTGATDPMVDNSIDFAITSCESGYKVAYFCENCKTLYKNVPVLDNEDTEADEREKNIAGTEGFTNEAGFVLDRDAYEGDGEGVINVKKLDEAQLKTLLTKVDDHRGQHVVYIPMNYNKLAGQYAAPTCIEEATLPVVCVNCGASLQYTYDEIAAQITNINNNNTTEIVKHKFVFATADEVKAALGMSSTETFTNGKDAYIINDSENDIFAQSATVSEQGALAAEARVNPDNHANQPFACGDHCNAVLKDATGAIIGYCSGFDTDKDENGNYSVVVSQPANFDADDHTTVTVEFGLSARLNGSYLSSYALKIAVVEKADLTKDSDGVVNGVDWTKAELLTIDTIAKCSGVGTTYALPTEYTLDAAKAIESTGTADKFYVLVNSDGKVYPIEQAVSVYNEDAATFVSIKPGTLVATTDGSGAFTESNPGTVQVPSGDEFFIDFGGNDTTPTRPAVPVEVSDATSFALAITNADYDTTQKAYVVKFQEGADISVAYADGDSQSAASKALEDAVKALAAKFESDGDNASAVVVDLNGGSIDYTIAYRFADTHFNGFDAVTFKNGTIEIIGTQDADKVVDKFAIAMTTSDLDLTLDNVDLITNKSAIYIGTTYKGTVTIVDSNITTYGTYGIYVGDDTETHQWNGTETAAYVLDIDDSTITCTRDFATDPDAEQLLSTALFVASKAEVTVDGSTLSAAGQAMVVRGGTVLAADTSFVLIAGYEDVAANDATYGVEEGDLGITSVGYGGKTLSLAPGRALQVYRQHGVWDKTNHVVRAAIVIGNSSETAYYKLATDVTLNDVRIDASAVEDAEEIEIAARYDVDGKDAVNGSVSVEYEGYSDYLEAAISDNSIRSLITINGTALTD